MDEQHQSEREMTEQERHAQMQKQNELFIKDLEAVMKKHSVTCAFGSIEMANGIILEYEQGLPLTKKFGMLKLALLNAETRQKLGMEAQVRAQLIEQQRQSGAGLILAKPRPDGMQLS
jgi:hypothetical protein